MVHQLDQVIMLEKESGVKKNLLLGKLNLQSWQDNQINNKNNLSSKEKILINFTIKLLNKQKKEKDKYYK